jgi:hypothetical protein
MTISTGILTTWLAAVHRHFQSPRLHALATAITDLPASGLRIVLDPATRGRLINQAHLSGPGLRILLNRLTDAGLLTRDPAGPGQWARYTLTLPHHDVEPATWNDISACARLAATALADQPLGHWLIPDPKHRTGILTDYLAIRIEHALFHGCVTRTTDHHAVAIWIDHTRPVPPPVEYHHRRRRACGPHSGRIAVLDALLDTHTPTTDHHRLTLLAINPGPGSDRHVTALLRHRHNTLDRAGLPAHLPNTTGGDDTVYRSHGYQPTTPIYLPDAGISLHPMWRPPNPIPAAPEPGN